MKFLLMPRGITTNGRGTAMVVGENQYMRRVPVISVTTTWHLPQQMTEVITINLVVIWTKTSTNLMNIRHASAAIHRTDARVKYCKRAETRTHPAKISVRSMPVTKTTIIHRIAAQSCTWNLDVWCFRSFLLKAKRTLI